MTRLGPGGREARLGSASWPSGHSPPPPLPWKNRSLVPKRLGTSDLEDYPLGPVQRLNAGPILLKCTFYCKNSAFLFSVDDSGYGLVVLIYGLQTMRPLNKSSSFISSQSHHHTL